MKEKHRKHPKLGRPDRGMFHQSEWAIYGTDCASIEQFYYLMVSELGDKNITYVDADHTAEKDRTLQQIGKKQFFRDMPIHWNEYDDKLQSWNADITLVNGNHYPAKRQIVILNPKKEASLRKRVEQLRDLDFIVKPDADTKIFSFLEPYITEDTQIITEREVEVMIKFFEKKIAENQAPLKALVLAGGGSRRMGQDKATLDYHGTDQQVHIANLCRDAGLETYISKAHNSAFSEIESYTVIKDRMIEMGPFGAILSAFMTEPDTAWLVLACDLPLLDKETIDNLILGRNASAHATAYKLSDQPFPEPLIAIYEPSIYQRMLRFMSLGYACPRKVLINSDTEILELHSDAVATNANTPEERAEVMSKLGLK